MRRAAFGILAIVFFVGGVLLLLLGPSGESYLMLGASGLRIGLVLAAFWLAYPQLVRIPWWLVQAVLAGALVVAIRPKAAVIVLPILLALWLVRPRKKKQPAPRRRPQRLASREQPRR